MVKKYWKLIIVIILGLAFAGKVYSSGQSSVFPAFSSITLDGANVNADIFSGKELTMINIWTTWCPPCVKEMPDLGNLGRSMPEGSQLIGIVLDVEGPGDADTINEAKRIMSMAKADFIQIFPSEEMKPVLSAISAIPTTIFVDSKGNIVGVPLVGARDEKAYRVEVENLLKSKR